MTGEKDRKTPAKAAERRAEALRDNLHRRKLQARGRAAESAGSGSASGGQPPAQDDPER